MTHNTLVKYLGRRIASLRKAKSLSQFEFADAAGKMINTVLKLNGVWPTLKFQLWRLLQKFWTSRFLSCFLRPKRCITFLPALEMIVRLLENENEKVQKTALKQIEVLLSIKNNN